MNSRSSNTLDVSDPQDAQDPLVCRIGLSAAVRARYPEFRLRVVYAIGVHNGPSDASTQQWLREGAAEGLARLGNRRPADHPAISAWRDAYSRFGAKPSAYPCSVEALLQRAFKGGTDAVPAINRLVDAYNSVSLAWLLPLGGEDLDRLVGRGELRFATANDCESPGLAESERPKPGEVIWADELGATCRRWNWRQGTRTRLTECTRNAYFIIEGLCVNGAEPEVDAAAHELCTRIQTAGQPQSMNIVRVV